VECDAATWQRVGFERMSEADSRHYCERVFARDLGGCPLLTNKSLWINYRAVTNRRWSYRNLVLIGDALRTVHSSVGSGTRIALQDSVDLARAFANTNYVQLALEAFELFRRPQVDEFLWLAEDSFQRYEHFRDKLNLDPVPFTYDYVMRSGRISHSQLKQRSPRLAEAYEAWLAQRHQPLPVGLAIKAGAKRLSVATCG
jgi:2-polyprenyl-6-methoxyphenol hydroxylase-like FAD-dependent oxidoreductase